LAFGDYVDVGAGGVLGRPRHFPQPISGREGTGTWNLGDGEAYFCTSLTDGSLSVVTAA
jgi:hypothetical protein